MAAPRLGELIPDFRLPSHRGGLLGPWDFKQRRNLCVLFHHGLGCPECREVRAEVARRYADFREHQCEVLAVSPDPAPELARAAEEESLPYPLLSDRGGVVLAAYLPGDGSRLPFAFVADRYGALARLVAGEGHHLDLEAAVEELAYLQQLCPECPPEIDE